ncbi:MAG: DUF190 domain-containing protein [Chitinophagaceae bacterium]
MELNGSSQLLRVFIGESDKLRHQPLYEAILFAAREKGLAGCTVTRGILSYGASTRVHSAKLIDVSEDLPIIIEIIDREEKIREFVKTVDGLITQAACGGLITLEKAEVLYYKSRTQKDRS